MRVVVAEDETLLREGLVLVLQRAGIDVVGTSPDADHLLEVVDETEPDVVITDIRMPPGRGDDGLQAAIEIRRRHPKMGVLVLSQFVQRRYAIELVADDPVGVGYLLKERVADVDRFIGVLHQVADGGTVLDPEVVQVMVARASRSRAGVDRLTPRQREVLELIAQGRANAAIATRLGISEKSVVQHASRIYDDLGLAQNPADHRRVLAVIRFLDQ